MDSRINMTFRNAFWSYFSMIASLVIQFISRTVFIYCLGETYSWESMGFFQMYWGCFPLPNWESALR